MSASRSGGPISNESVVNEGFTPLRKVSTTPAGATEFEGKRMSFSQKNATDVPQEEWPKSAYNMMRKMSSFRGQGGGIRERYNAAVAVVDPFSTGAHLAKYVAESGYYCVRVLSILNSPVAALVQEGLTVDFDATVQHDDLAADWSASVDMTAKALSDLPWPIIAVVPGAETGVELADRLSFRMGLPSNGEELTEARRNKYIMGETVRAAGVRAVKQKLATTMQDIEDFLLDHNPTPFKCVVKPVQSAGTDDVFLCNSADEARTAFLKIAGKRNGLGLINTGALIQEFLAGQEFVIDTVSLNGVHKVVCCWEYDKRNCNGANFVYFGMRSRSAADPRVAAIIPYARQVLDALKVQIGPGHMEVMWCRDGPCLVEVGTRCHGGEGTWIPISMECIGTSVEKVALDVYVNPSRWEALPNEPVSVLKYGREVDMVNRHPGILRAIIGEAHLRALPSFRSLCWECKPGDFMPLTIDCFTRPGCVQLVHESEEQADTDFEAVHRLEATSMFDYSIICPAPPATGAVVVVDPFSSGANIAAMVSKMGYKLIMVFSEKDSPVAALVSSGTSLRAQLSIQHDNTLPDQEAAIRTTLEALRSQKAPVLAIIPGAETGVALADRLAARFHTRNNGEELTPARRNKYLMQERVRTCGVRAVLQANATSTADVAPFLATYTSTPFRVIVKPVESAGSDSIFLCISPAEVESAVAKIVGHKNQLGHSNASALMQEYLEGTEFVVDSVSRDGIHKAITVWEYDKRTVNGANFVYFGMWIRSCTDPRVRELIQYSKQVLDALGIVNGPSHMEIMYTSTGPCLVEVGSRCHGGEATWLPIATECLGYNQLEATLDCYLRPDRFDNLPPEPYALRNHGAEVFLVSHQSGSLNGLPGLAFIRQLESFRSMEMSVQPGRQLLPTIDCFTRPGSIQLVNPNLTGLEADYERIRALENEGLFEVL